MLRRWFSILAILGLLASNVATLTLESFQLAASGLLAAASIPTVHQKKAKAAAQKKLLLKSAGANIKKRTIKSAAVNVGSMAGEALPFVGWAVIVGATGYELKLACENLLDLESLYDTFGIAEDEDRSAIEKICNPSLPESADELTDWAKQLTTVTDGA
ncbi:MAG: hypothetical protein V7709_02275 [Halioglobus sp.]